MIASKIDQELSLRRNRFADSISCSSSERRRSEWGAVEPTAGSIDQRLIVAIASQAPDYAGESAVKLNSLISQSRYQRYQFVRFTGREFFGPAHIQSI